MVNCTRAFGTYSGVKPTREWRGSVGNRQVPLGVRDVISGVFFFSLPAVAGDERIIRIQSHATGMTGWNAALSLIDPIAFLGAVGVVLSALVSVYTIRHLRREHATRLRIASPGVALQATRRTKIRWIAFVSIVLIAAACFVVWRLTARPSVTGQPPAGRSTS